MAGLDDGTWHCMTDAPKDGTEVELLLRHVNYRYCTTDDERAQWEQVVRSSWIDFNGGGWTWHGMAGSIVGWRPLSSNGRANRRRGSQRRNIEPDGNTCVRLSEWLGR